MAVADDDAPGVAIDGKGFAVLDAPERLRQLGYAAPVVVLARAERAQPSSSKPFR